MRTDLSAVLIGACLLGAIWTAVLAARNRRADNRVLILLLVAELLTLAQFVIAVVAVIGGDRPDSTSTFLSYAFTVLLMLPAGVLWSQTERSRSGTLVLTLACFSVAVMSGRMLQLWSSAGA